MIVHKKTHHYRLKLSLKTDHPAPYPSSITTTNPLLQSRTPDVIVPLEQTMDERSPEGPDVDPNLQVAPFDVGPQLDDLRRKTDKRDKFFGRTDALLKTLGELSEVDLLKKTSLLF
jgi:hypothetical protein